MNKNHFSPTFFVRINGSPLSEELINIITSFSFTDNEKQLDLLELNLISSTKDIFDNSTIIEGAIIETRFGYSNNLSLTRKMVIKEIEYRVDSSGFNICLCALDMGFNLAGKIRQEVWVGNDTDYITYSHIAERMAIQYGLNPEIEPTSTKHLRISQSCSDSQFLSELAQKAVSEDGKSGYVFFVEDNQLHFHPRDLEQKPAIRLYYNPTGSDQLGIISFSAKIQAQGAKGASIQTKAIAIDPRKKTIVEHVADNKNVSNRSSLGNETVLVDGGTGEISYSKNQTGEIVSCDIMSEDLVEEPQRQPVQERSEATFTHAEMNQIEASATIIGIPELKAKQNIEIIGIGGKLSGIYYCQTVKHQIDQNGYICELSLLKNAVGTKTVSSSKTGGKPNTQKGSDTPDHSVPKMEHIKLDGKTGKFI